MSCAGRTFRSRRGSVAVADSFDAMTTDRPYREGLPVDVAFQRLEDGRGEQWDPQRRGRIPGRLRRLGRAAEGGRRHPGTGLVSPPRGTRANLASQAGVAELADAADLKSAAPQGASGFEPLLRYQVPNKQEGGLARWRPAACSWTADRLQAAELSRDVVEHAFDGCAEEGNGPNDHYRDEREDECVLRETLSFLTAKDREQRGLLSIPRRFPLFGVNRPEIRMMKARTSRWQHRPWPTRSAITFVPPSTAGELG